MAKRSSFTVLMLTAMLSFTCVSVYADSINIAFNVRYADPNYGKDGQHRGPVQIPEISLDGNSLFFNTSCDGCTLRLLDENGIVVYSIIIPTGTTSMVLPSNLSGEYEIQIIQGNLYFYGYIFL